MIVNPSAPIGPGDVRPTPTGRIVLEAARGRIPAYVDTGLNVVHVDDVAAGHLLAFERGAVGERYILGGQNLTLGEILTLIAVLAGRRPPRLRLPAGLILPIAYLSELAARLGRAARAAADRRRPAHGAESGCTSPRPRPSASSATAAGPPPRRVRDALDWYRRNGYLANIPEISLVAIRLRPIADSAKAKCSSRLSVGASNQLRGQVAGIGDTSPVFTWPVLTSG